MVGRHINDFMGPTTPSRLLFAHGLGARCSIGIERRPDALLSIIVTAD